MKTSIIILLILFQVSTLSASSLTDSIMTVDSSIIEHKNNYSVNNIYLDAGSVLLSSYVNLNYERLLSNIICIRLGYGLGYRIQNIADGPTIYGETINLLMCLLLFEGNSKFEIGFGGGYFHELDNFRHLANKFVYSFCIGYRYQPQYGGILFRSGFSLINPGLGFNISIGYTF
ncbi:MAG: hypothetical protein HZB41_09780 [Ignavibacteriae bacterium]|nr:hypothetical protein [Ignavibacteriota bacterium]